MANGLNINLEQFKNMKSQDRDELIYQNLLDIRKGIGDMKFHRKIQYVWLSALSLLFGARKFLGF